MTPVDQQTDHDCVRACIASLLSVPIDGVADFGNGDDQWQRVNDWLGQRGLYMVTLDAKAFADWRPGGYHLMGGPAHGEPPPGESVQYHAVVGYRGDVVHDPHPSRLGLASVETYRLIVVADLRLVKPGGDAP